MKQVQWKEERRSCENRSTLLPYLRALRQDRGLSQRGLGRLANVSTGTVYRLENQVRGAYPVTVQKLAGALEVAPVELVRGRLRQ